MKILFGIQGTGNGHISRARILAKYLAEHQIDVTYLISGREKAKLFDMEIFGDFWHRKGLTFATNDGKINYLETFKQNSVLEFIRDIRALPVRDYDLVITDFEPVSAWAGKLAKVPVLGVGHQYAFGENTPLAGESMMAKWIMQNFAPANKSIGLHWHPYSDNVLPPIIDTNLSPGDLGEHILIYLPFENQKLVTQVLNQLPNVNFIQYSPELIDGHQGNVALRKTSYQAFKNDLVSARGVICNSGFELISECLHLGLPILTKPLNGQMEQHSNALALEQLNYAKVTSEISLPIVSQWLEKMNVPQARPLPNVAKSIAEWVAQGAKDSHQQLGKSLWQKMADNL
ncbi:MJ1255/VC2487 family glycosyltransferase [Thalassotalea euphylliae]|uniref:MJ1255/VC2487 family glycosyltransferase n=1 Tax=Thalassotalea euphylliae TaxID=1655234 RepID=UPI00362BEC00